MDKKQHGGLKIANIILVIWCFFIGIGAVAGSIGMFVAPDGSALGMQSLLPYFQVLPFAKILFQDYIFSGIALLCVNGITNLVAAILLLCRKKSGIICGGIFGVTLMAWIVIQFVIFPANFLSTIYFIFGALQAITGYTAYVFYKQQQFEFNAEKYNNIGTNANELVVFFSRKGYTKKIAYETAQKSGAEICELKSPERTEGVLGFLWCGRFGMHGWGMPIEKTGLDLTKYKKVTICSPIWVFGIAGPIRTFCQEAKGQIETVDYILLHFMNSRFEKVGDKMDQLLATKREQLTSICCRMGKFKTLHQKNK